MAKKSGQSKLPVPGNKSAAIRLYKEQNPDAKPKEIAAHLNEQGYDISPQYISTILSNYRRKNGIVGRPGRRPGSGGVVEVEHLMLVKELVTKVGSVKAAKQAVDQYAELMA